MTAADGTSPSVLIQAADASLYGIADHGGSLGQGTVFSIKPDGAASVVYSFTTGILHEPLDHYSLAHGLDASLYGTVSVTLVCPTPGLLQCCPRPGQGVQNTARWDVCHPAHVRRERGLYPQTLIRGINGNFYGGTEKTIFEMTPDGAVTVLHSLTSNLSGLSQGSDGVL
jgi:uncharacterized repeat protein (TIGR03803 family)